jgi:hypothetical protein
MAATRYGVMMLRYAETLEQPRPRRRRFGKGGWMAG